MAPSYFSPGLISAFYLVLYAILGGFFAMLLVVFYQTLPADKPALSLHTGQAILRMPGQVENWKPDICLTM